MDEAKRIIRRATPPWVRKLPARMKNGIAMISKLSIPVNSFSATASIGTCVITNRKLSTVRPSAIEIGMPVSISAISSAEDQRAVHRGRVSSAARSPGRGRALDDTFDMARIVMRQLAGAPERPRHLQEAEAHQVGAERHAQEDDPARHLHVGRDLLGRIEPDDEFGAHRADHAVNSAPQSSPNRMTGRRPAGLS